jgi:Tol biopolymer transport system component
LIGEPQPVAEQVGSRNHYGFFSASKNGVLVYKPNTTGQFRWVDRHGRELARIGEPGNYQTFDLSKDASRLVASRVQPGGKQNLWIVGLLRGSTTRLTLEEANHTDPRWSPDGRQVIFTSTRDPSRSPFRVSLSSPDPERVFKFEGRQFGLDDWSPDGRYLLYHDSDRNQMWALPLEGDQKPVLAVRSLSGVIDQGQFSPDSRWIAYHTNESGRYEVKVVPFPPTGDKWQVSTAGGVQPTWRGDGGELYFLAADTTLTAIDIRLGAKFELGMPRPLFKIPHALNVSVEQYAPAPDGNRFLLMMESSPPFTVVLNWTALLKNSARQGLRQY